MSEQRIKAYTPFSSEWHEIGERHLTNGKTYIVYGNADRTPSPLAIRIAKWEAARGFFDPETKEKIGGWQSHWMELPPVPIDDEDDDDE